MRNGDSCQAYQRTSRHVEVKPWPFPERPRTRLHEEFGGLFMGRCFLVVVDAFSKWVKIVAATSPSVKGTISALRQIFARQGLPDLIPDNVLTFAGMQYLEFFTRNEILRTLVPPTTQPQTALLNGGTDYQVKHEEKLSLRFLHQLGKSLVPLWNHGS